MPAAVMAPSPPIDIVTPSRVSSSSPRNQSSNLTSALQNASAGVDIPSAGQSRPAPSRHESGGLGIPVGRNMSASANRRGSNTGGTGMSLSGMSWGGMSVGSWLQDDILMTGTSPLNTTMQSPSLHSSSYLPKMEANFWNNLRCCDIGFNDLHELLQHYEEAHASAQPSFSQRMSLSRSFRRKSSFMNSGGQAQPAATQIRGFQAFAPDNDMNAGFSRGATANSTGDAMRFSSGHDMDTIGEMEMDDAPDFASPEPSGPFASARPSPINPALANVAHASRQNTSSPSTPNTARQTNPMVSSVNTPTFPSATQSSRTSPDTGLPPTTSPFNPHLLSTLNADMGNLDFGNGEPNGDMTDLCINDPARALFSDNGRINPQQAMQFGFTNGANGNGSRAIDPMTSPRLAAARAMLPPEDDRPYKCKVIGCEKAYKNSNGLRYHERHGHTGQKLRDNEDGSRSIVDPDTDQPYPGTLGMEKEKPYNCDVCMKRYKNLNGLKYHRNHSAPCNPEVNGGLASLALTQPAKPTLGTVSGSVDMF